MGVLLRYGVYGAVTMLTLATYVLWDADEAPLTLGPSLRAGGEALLPALNLMDSRAEAGIKRDLFSLPAAPVAATAEITVAPPPPPMVDRLAGVQVLGFARQHGSLAILVRVGNESMVISKGEKFGQDDALAISSIDAGQVRVEDQLANVFKTFMLSDD